MNGYVSFYSAASAALTSTAYVAYRVANGEVGQALLVPAAVYGIYKVGEYVDSETISKLAVTVLASVALAAPGTITGSVVYILGGKTIPMGIIACLVGSGITYKVVDKAIDIAAPRAAKAACSF